MKQQDDQYFSKTLAKGLRVLALFNEQAPVHTQTEISRTLGINPTSTYRLINTLVRLGYLQKDRETKKLRLGLGALGLATTLLRTFDGPHTIRSLVDDVHERHGVTVDVALVLEDALTIVYRREAQETMNYRLPLVSRSWHTTSLGKAYMAFIPEDVLEKTMAQLSFEPRTKSSITTPEGLIEELGRVRERGYSISNEEFLPGLITIGAPLIHPAEGWAVGAVSFDFTTVQYTLERMMEEYADRLEGLARDLSEAITTM